MLGELGKYCRALLNHFVVLLTGSVLAAAFTWLPSALNLPPIPEILIAGCLGIAAFIATFRAWRDQHRMVSELTSSRLLCVVSGIGFSRRSDTQVGVTLSFHLTNGTATQMVLDEFAICVSDPDINPRSCLRMNPRDDRNQPVPLPLTLPAYSVTPTLLTMDVVFEVSGGVPDALPFKKSASLRVRDQVSRSVFEGPIRRHRKIAAMKPLSADGESIWSNVRSERNCS